MTRHLSPLVALLWLAAPAQAATGPLAPLPSAFGCAEYEYSTAIPSVEGKDGVFYRTFADLRLQHALEDAVVAQLGALSRALAERGTTLVYVTIPSKSQAMPSQLPERAANYGFDIDIGETVYDDIVTRLRAEGIVTPDIMRALQSADPDGEKPFFGTDFHWSAAGARLAAEAIGAAIKESPAYAELTPTIYETTPAGTQEAFSGMRRALQGFCVDPLPPVLSSGWETTATSGGEGALDIGLGDAATAETGTIDIFAADDAQGERPAIVLVGTSFSDSEVNNFPGFIQQYSGLEVVNYAITGGNQFGAITSYLTSDEFAAAPPHFLVWENPIYNNLGQYGPGPLEELIAAAGPACDQALALTTTDATGFGANLPIPADGATALRDATLMIDYGGEGARKVEVELVTAGGITRRATIERGDRLRATGRFYLDLGGFWMPDLAAVRVKFDRPLAAEMTEKTGLFLCRTP